MALDFLREKGVKIALGSASKNAPLILEKTDQKAIVMVVTNFLLPQPQNIQQENIHFVLSLTGDVDSMSDELKKFVI